MQIEFKHNTSIPEAKGTIERAVQKIPGFRISLRWQSETTAVVTASAGRKSIKGRLTINDNTMLLTLDLPPLVAAFAKPIKKGILTEVTSAFPQGEVVD